MLVVGSRPQKPGWVSAGLDSGEEIFDSAGNRTTAFQAHPEKCSKCVALLFLTSVSGGFAGPIAM
jgi:hypothetical protein